jgi:hypothetical protein
MARLLIVVSRNEPELYRNLRQDFARIPQVEVVVDRRVRERRTRQGLVPIERRHADRRRHEIAHRIRLLGWEIVRLPDQT